METYSNLHLHSSPPNLPTFDTFSLKSNAEIESDVCDRFVYYAETRRKVGAVLKNPKTGQTITRTALENSRYHPTGQRKIQRKIHHRLGDYKPQGGMLMTPTYASSDSTQTSYQGMTRQEAWSAAGYRIRYLMDRINKLRKSKGLGKIKRYIRVIEEQPDRLYPHYHIWFPGLRWLADYQEIQHLWPYGNVDFEYRDSQSASEYIIAYISKMEGREFFLAMTWEYKLRFYSLSRDYEYSAETKPPSGWTFVSSFGEFANKRVRIPARLQHRLDSIQPLIQPRGS